MADRDVLTRGVAVDDTVAETRTAKDAVAALVPCFGAAGPANLLAPVVGREVALQPLMVGVVRLAHVLVDANVHLADERVLGRIEFVAEAVVVGGGVLHD